MTAESRKNSNTDPNKIDWTRSNITVEGTDFSVNEGNIDWQPRTHHTLPNGCQLLLK